MQPCETIQIIPLRGYVEHPIPHMILYCPVCGASYEIVLFSRAANFG